MIGRAHPLLSTTACVRNASRRVFRLASLPEQERGLRLRVSAGFGPASPTTGVTGCDQRQHSAVAGPVSNPVRGVAYRSPNPRRGGSPRALAAPLPPREGRVDSPTLTQHRFVPGSGRSGLRREVLGSQRCGRQQSARASERIPQEGHTRNCGWCRRRCAIRRRPDEPGGALRCRMGGSSESDIMKVMG
jgi:hypothetical protein